MADVTQALKDTENALQDYIASVLAREFGDDWVDRCGVSAERIAKWKERMQTERRRLRGAALEERLIYFADFYDLKTILKKHWSHFANALGDLKSMEIWLAELEKFRDPDAHRRELLPHQKHLALGISGEIRSRLVRYRSKQETAQDYFPRIESVRDNLGNIWTPDRLINVVMTQTVLRPGDHLGFVVTARDPLEGPLEYRLLVKQLIGLDRWQKSNELGIDIVKAFVGEAFVVDIAIRSKREFHANGDHDHTVQF